MAVLREQARPGIEKFIKNASTTRYRTILLVEAKPILNTENHEALEIVMDMFTDVYEKRNRFAHWICGISPQIPKGLLLQDPKDHWRDLLAMTEHMAGWPEKRNADIPKPNKRRILVYEHKDFEEVEADVGALTNALQYLHQTLTFPQGADDPDSPGRRARARLYALPQYQKAKSYVLGHPRSMPPKSLGRRLARLLRQLLRAFREFFQARSQ